jgi:hypothetical protein
MANETFEAHQKQGKRSTRLTRIIDIRASYYEAELLKELKIPKEATIQDRTVPLFPQYVPKAHSPSPRSLPIASTHHPAPHFTPIKAYSTPQAHRIPKTERSANLRMQQILERRIKTLDEQLARLRPRHTRGASLPL